ncbi:hypothetical protein C8035_v008114 [Colletotrichum spinosum]|uniref:Uncharacterized protein n=1 Tax=Colletotrichum spinosum TaxID=1347390 RepID=A0A4R8QGW1_9PEZI|nr:hypothetical protein C8035_v008114 [Colletotrichum spinosum]
MDTDKPTSLPLRPAIGEAIQDEMKHPVADAKEAIEDNPQNEHSNDVFAELNLSLPKLNYSAHPDILQLAGLDFEVDNGGGFTGIKKSGVVGKILLPFQATQDSPSRAGRLNVAKRIKTSFAAATRIFHTHEHLSAERHLWFLVFDQLRQRDRSWNFIVTAKAESVMLKIVQARKAFLGKGGDSTTADAEFQPFLESIDEYIAVVEPGLKARVDNRDNTEREQRILKRGFESTPDSASNDTKKARANTSDIDKELEGKPLEEQVAMLKEKLSKMEKQRDVCNERLMEVSQASMDDSIEWTRIFRDFWREVLPLVNEARDRAGREELAENQLVEFLRSVRLFKAVDWVLGIPQRGRRQ